MVKYYGRARTRTGSVNTNQLGLKMSGCPSTVGKQGRIARYMGRRVDCMMGLCKPIRYHEVLWPRTRMRNQPPFCRAHATKCLAAAGGVGTNHNIPYYRIPKRGESGCTPATVNTDGIHLLTAAAITTHPDPSDPSSTVDQVGFIAQDPIYDAHGGSLEPSSYKGVNIIALSTNAALSQLGILTAGGTPPPFSSITFSGGDLPAAYSLSVSDAAAAPAGPLGNYYANIFSSPFLFTAGQTYRVTFS